MNASPSSPAAPRFEVRPTAAEHFAWIRTRLAIERTLLAWVRTAISLIGFGFTIVQFFERFSGFEDTRPLLMPDAPRYLGLTLILLGTVTLVISWVEYRQAISYIRSGDFAVIAGEKSMTRGSPLYIVVIAMAFIGTFCFFSILLGYM